MTNTKYMILSELKKENNYISGQELAEAFSISRAAVNKAVTALRKEGYIINAVPHLGYILLDSPDELNPGEIMVFLGNDRMKTVSVYRSLVSTNVTLHEMAENNSPTGQVVLAESQSGGRGRKESDFSSPDKLGIYLSYLIRHDDLHCKTSEITPLAAEAVKNALAKMDKTGMVTDSDFHINETGHKEFGGNNVANPGSAMIDNESSKEPFSVRDLELSGKGDILYKGEKICGILTEMLVESENSYVRYAMTGIGLRLNNPKKRALIAAEIIKEMDRIFEL